MLEIFENYSVANPESKIEPPTTKLSPTRMTDVLENYLKENNYYDTVIDTNFFDIYSKKSGFEVSFQLISNGSGTLINVTVYGKNRRGKTRKFLKLLLDDIKKIC